jgi:hypothetical protein
MCIKLFNLVSIAVLCHFLISCSPSNPGAKTIIDRPIEIKVVVVNRFEIGADEGDKP